LSNFADQSRVHDKDISENNDTDPRQIILYTLLAVTIWGAFTAVAAGAISQGASFLSVGITTQIGIAALLALISFRYYSTLLHVVRISLRFWPIILLAGFLFPARDIFFLYALSSAPKLTVTAIDALWPIFLVIFAAIFAVRRKNSIDAFGLLMLLSAFGGAMLVMSGDDAVEQFIAAPNTDSLILIIPYLAALFGAMCAAGENVSLKYIRDKSELTNNVKTTLCLSAFARIVGVLYIIFGLYIFEFEIRLPGLSGLNIAYLIFGWTIASIAFTHAVLATANLKQGVVSRFSMANVSSLAYLSPAINAVILSLFFPEEQLTGLVVGGISIVVVANFLINSGARYAKATYGTLIFALWFSVVSLFTPPSGDAEFLFTLAQVSGTVLAILASFTLWRLADLIIRRRKMISDLSRAAESLLDEARSNDHDTYQLLISKHDNVLRSIVSDLFMSSQIPGTDLRETEDLRRDRDLHLLDSAYDFEDTVRKTLHLGDIRIQTALTEFAHSVDQWVSSRRSRLVAGEFFIISTLAAITIAAVFLARPREFESEIMILGFCSALVFLVLAIRDLSWNRWNLTYDDIRAVERFFERCGLVPCLPAHIIEFREMPNPPIPRTFRLSTSGGRHVVGEVTVLPQPEWVAWLARVLILGGFAGAALLLALSHSLI